MMKVSTQIRISPKSIVSRTQELLAPFTGPKEYRGRNRQPEPFRCSHTDERALTSSERRAVKSLAHGHFRSPGALAAAKHRETDDIRELVSSDTHRLASS